MIPSSGQIWRNSGGDRFVRAVSFTRSEVKVVSVKKNALGDWQRTLHARDTKIRADRFVHGYDFVENA